MKAVVAGGPGGPEVLEIALVDRPTPGADEVLTRVMACGLNPVDCKIRQGYLSANRTYPAIYGFDIAGVIEEVGAHVTTVKPGDEVYYLADLSKQGGYAEYHVAQENLVALKPESLSFVEAASLPVAAVTSYQALFTQGHLGAGETAVIFGAAGGVGSIAVQLAKNCAARTVGVCSTQNLEYVKSLGATLVVDYTTPGWIEAIKEATEGGPPLVFDTVGGESFFDALELVKPFGRVVFLNAFAGEDPVTRINPGRLKNVTIICTMVRSSGATLRTISHLSNRGALTPQVERVISLSDIGEAHRRLESRHGRGKIVVDMMSSSQRE
jgi:NADPH:quinone reductase-like Zn-dependent oxidoreductase